MAFGTAFAMKSPLVKDKISKKNGIYLSTSMLQWDEKFDVDELEKIKKRPLELLFLGEYIFEDLKKIAEFDESIIEIWNTDVSYKGRDYGEGTEWEVHD